MKIHAFQTVSLLVLATAFASAQERFSVLLTTAPTYTHSRVSFIIPYNNGQLTPETFSINTSALGYKIGAMAQYAFTPTWSVSTGLWYSRMGTNSLFSFSPGDNKTRIIQQDWQVPLLIHYRSNPQRLSPYFSVGALVNFQQVTLFRTAGDITKVQANQTADYRPILGAGIAYKLSHHLSFTAQPLFIWRFKPKGDYEQYVVYQLQAQLQLLYSL